MEIPRGNNFRFAAGDRKPVITITARGLDRGLDRLRAGVHRQARIEPGEPREFLAKATRDYRNDRHGRRHPSDRADVSWCGRDADADGRNSPPKRRSSYRCSACRRHRRDARRRSCFCMGRVCSCHRRRCARHRAAAPRQLLRTGTPEDVVATFPYLSDLTKIRLPGLVRPVGGTAGGRGKPDAAAPHGVDDAAEIQWSRRGRNARRFRCVAAALLDALLHGNDLRKAPKTDSYEFGFLPPRLFNQVRDGFVAFHRAGQTKTTSRT